MWTKAEYSKVIEAMEAVKQIVTILETLETLARRGSNFTPEIAATYTATIDKSLREIVKAIVEEMEKAHNKLEDK